MPCNVRNLYDKWSFHPGRNFCLWYACAKPYGATLQNIVILKLPPPLEPKYEFMCRTSRRALKSSLYLRQAKCYLRTFIQQTLTFNHSVLCQLGLPQSCWCRCKDTYRLQQHVQLTSLQSVFFCPSQSVVSVPAIHNNHSHSTFITNIFKLVQIIVNHTQ